MDSQANSSSSEQKASSTAQISSTAEHIFSGRAGSGNSTRLNCENLSSNPFSLSSANSGGGGILAKPRFSLKPASFSVNAAQSGDAESDKPVADSQSNPFLRPAKLNYENSDDTENTNVKVSSSFQDQAIDSNNKSDPSTSSSEAAVVRVDSASSSSSTPGASSQSFSQRVNQAAFVFGEKLDDRVVNAAKENGGSNGHSADDADGKPKIITLEEAAEEYKKQQESGPLLPEVETVTGEESESNVMQINCKLFLFDDKDNSWAEKGRGVLRLNDDAEGAHSRIVMRTASIHRVILNTSIFAMMICERASPKSIRITGTEQDQVHVYLVSGSPADMDQLHSAVMCRIQKLKKSAPAAADNEAVASSSDAAASSSDAAASSTTKRKTESEVADSETSPNKKQKPNESGPTSTSSD